MRDVESSAGEAAEEQLRRANRALRLLGATSQAVIRAEDEPRLAQEVCQLTLEAEAASLSWVALGGPDGLAVVATAGAASGLLAPGSVGLACCLGPESPAVLAVRSHHPQVVRDVALAPAFAACRREALELGIRSTLTLPLLGRAGGEPQGVLTLCASRIDAFGEEELAILQQVADDLGFGLMALRRRSLHRDTERELQTVLDTSPDLLALLDAQGRVKYVSSAFERLFGGSRQRALARTVDELWRAPEGARLHQAIRRVAATGAPDQLELDLLTTAGARPFEVRLVPQRGEAGVVSGVLGVATDLSARRAAVRQQFILGRALDDTADGVYVIESMTSRLLYVNQAAADLLGYTREELTGGMTVGDLDPSFTPSGFALAWRTRRVPYTARFETSHRTKAGELVPVEVRTTRFHYEGEVLNLALARDLREKRASEAQLKEREALYESVVAALREGVLLEDEAGRVVAVNPEAERILGAAAAELVGTSLEARGYLLVGEDGRPLPPDQFPQRQALLTGLPRSDVVVELWRRDGSSAWLSINTQPLARPGEPRPHGVVATLRDVTSQRQLEDSLRQAQKMEAVGRLAGGIAHDFNNLLAVIQLQTSLLLEDPALGQAAREGLGEVTSTLSRATTLTRQLLTFSRRQVPKMEPVDPSDAVSGMSRLLRRILGEDIEFETRLAPSLPAVLADVGMLEQVLMNLAVNARDAMPDGGRLSVLVDQQAVGPEQAARHRAAGPGPYVRLRVTDTGTGIRPEVLPHIFEPFFTTKEVGKGTGLGLPTAFGIVQQHRGWIEVASEVGRGTTFSVLLPALAQQGRAPAPPVRHVTGGQGTEAVLLVEDDAPLRSITRASLERYGYRVFEAHSAASALEAWQRLEGQVDLLLTDLVMPGGMTGRQLAEELVLRKPGLKVLYTSGYSPDVVDRLLPTREGRGFLPKPASAAELALAVRACLDAPGAGPAPS